jgi:integrase
VSNANSTPSAPAGKPDKPTPDFPLFPHATKRWAKKIKGKMHYFGPWEDPRGALKRYRDFLEGKAPTRGRKRRRDAKTQAPSKPRPDFPLFAHATKRWAKKIRGQLHYFGPWDDPDGAEAKYLEQKDALHAGKKPRDGAEGVTVKEAVNAFLNAKQDLVNSGELSPRTMAGYESAGVMLAAHMGKARLVADLDPQDFTALRGKMAKKWGPHRLGTTIQYVRSIFKYAFDSDLITVPVKFGPSFKKPSKKTMRLHKAKQGVKLFTAEELSRILGVAGVQLRAMVLLGINAGFGNNDCATLSLSALDLKSGWVNFPRPKTGIDRRFCLWPETIEALQAVLAKRKAPKDPSHAGLVFVTKYGECWAKEDSTTNPISQETAKVLKALKLNGHRNFYCLRHTFRTIADEKLDQVAVDHVMGHEIENMSSHYRETISDQRLKAVTDHVRDWLFSPAKKAEPTPAAKKEEEGDEEE